MTVPEIPGDVMDAVSAALAHDPRYPLDCHTPTEDYEAAYYIQAVWGRLYAASLRHAPDVVESPSETGEDVAVANGSYWRGRFAAVTELRRMADEVMP